jgi:hypothetical protein
MKSLTTIQLNKILHENDVTRATFLGTFPACMTPKTKKDCYTFITNSEEHDKGGLHWVAWSVKGKTVTFFDSFSRKPTNPSFPAHFGDILKKYEKTFYVSKRVQAKKSKRCGLFCIHWIYVISLGLDTASFLEEYTANYEKNDVKVLDFVNSIL